MTQNPQAAAAEFFQQGLALYDRGEYEPAIACFEGGLEIFPDDAQIWKMRGDALFSLDSIAPWRSTILYSFDSESRVIDLT